MIIPFQAEAYSFRYLPKSRHRALALFFPGANVAFRRSALKPIEFYDEKLHSGEDTDAGIRMVQQGELFSTSSARVVHTANLSLRKLMLQWWRIAVYTVRVIRKHCDPGVEVFVRFGGGLGMDAQSRNVFYRELKLPFTAILFLTPFLFLNIFAIVSLMTWGNPVALSLTAVAAAIYFRSDFLGTKIPIGKRIVFAALRFVINLMLLYGSLLEGFKHRLLYLNYELDARRA